MDGCKKLSGMMNENGVVEEQGLELRLAPPGYICKNQHNNYIEKGFGLKQGFTKIVGTKCLTKSDEILSQKLVSSHKRVAAAPVVGWPPVRSFRKNLAHGTPAKIISNSLNENSKEAMKRKSDGSRNGLFVKINMDGVLIGRKIDLDAYESYENLSYAIDELFRGVGLNGRGENTTNETKITGPVYKREEYTLVYEDNEGDRMLVGDVPWKFRAFKQGSPISMIPSGPQEQHAAISSLIKTFLKGGCYALVDVCVNSKEASRVKDFRSVNIAPWQC